MDERLGLPPDVRRELTASIDALRRQSDLISDYLLSLELQVERLDGGHQPVVNLAEMVQRARHRFSTCERDLNLAGNGMAMLLAELGA